VRRLIGQICHKSALLGFFVLLRYSCADRYGKYEIRILRGLQILTICALAGGHEKEHFTGKTSILTVERWLKMKLCIIALLLLLSCVSVYSKKYNNDLQLEHLLEAAGE
jgi:hypothetical protein